MESESVEEKVWKVGQLLEAKWTDGEYYYGEVKKVWNNGKYSFKYTDGSKDIHRYVHPFRSSSVPLQFPFTVLPTSLLLLCFSFLIAYLLSLVC
jgi:hypothetical protein